MPMDGHNSSIACYDVDTDGGEEKQAIEDLDDGGNNDTPSIIGGVPHHFVSDGRLLAGNVRKLDVDSTRDILSSQTWSWDEPLMMGIDEAGRGPVLGPMIYGSCVSPISVLPDLKKMGLADSKVLNEETRERLFTALKITPYISWIVDSISAATISSRMLRGNSESLNVLSHNSAMGMVSLFLSKGYNIQELYVDTVGDPKSYQAKLYERFPTIKKIVVASKADATYPIVSAASICAKQTRDHELRDWIFREEDENAGIEISKETGSGYPSDPNTKAWLQKNIEPTFGFPNLIRFSWSTSDNVLANSAAKISWGDTDKEDGMKKDSTRGQSKLLFTSTKKRDLTAVTSTDRSSLHKKMRMSLVSTLPLVGVSSSVQK